jgi:hypothetical protein
MPSLWVDRSLHARLPGRQRRRAKDGALKGEGMRGLGFYRYDHISVGVWQGRTEREYFDVLKGRGQVLATLGTTARSAQ